MDKIIKWHLQRLTKKQMIAFYVMVVFFVCCFILGITLTVIGASDFHTFVSVWKIVLENNTTPSSILDIAVFIYGLFFVVLSIILIFALLLYGNSIFNKKYKNKI